LTPTGQAAYSPQTSPADIRRETNAEATKEIPMRLLLPTALALLMTVGAAIPVAADEAANVRTMAGILAKLNHFPSDAEKKSLQAIVDDKTAGAHEKTLAQAIINTQHTVSAADKPKVEAITKDAAASAGLKTLADVLTKLNHTPSEADKQALTKLATAK
jgi:hypothetical protein